MYVINRKETCFRHAGKRFFIGKLYMAYQVKRNPDLPNYESAMKLIHDYTTMESQQLLLLRDGTWMVIPEDFDAVVIEV